MPVQVRGELDFFVLDFILLENFLVLQCKQELSLQPWLDLRFVVFTHRRKSARFVPADFKREHELLRLSRVEVTLQLDFLINAH